MSLMPEPAPDYSSGEGLLNYTDYDSVRSDLRKKVLGAVADSAVSENDKYLIRAVDVAYAKPDGRFSLSDQKSAILEGRTLSDKITGRWEVIDKETGKPVGKTGRKSIINVPFLTDRGTYIRNGSEYTFAKQLRLNSGIYTRVTDDSNVEAQFNAIPRSGPSFRIYMEPSTSYFYMRYKGRKIPLYPVLRAMGKEHDDIAAVWGKAIADENKVLEKSPYAVNFLKSFAEKATDTQQAQPKVSLDAKAGSVVAQLLQQKTGALASSMYTDAVREGIVGEFGKIGIDPRVTQVTMGEEHSNASPNAILSATGKILRVSKGQEDSDSRDSLEFQNVWDISDFISDKISNDQNGVLRQILWKVTKKNGDASAIPTAPLDKHVQHTFVSSGLAQAIEEINPLDMYDQNQRVLRLGEGAMTSVDVVPKEARGVQPTYFNYIDPVRAPECYAADMEVMTERGWVAWPDVTEEDVFACMVEGRLEYNKAEQVVSYPYSGEMCGADTNAISYLVTPDHRMWTRPAWEPRKDHYPKYGFEFAVDSDNEDRLHLASQDASFQSETVVKAEDTFVQQYEGQVYCATVPGGLLHVRRNNKSGFWCGNSLKIGVDMKMSRNVRRGPDKELYSKFIDARTGKEKWVGIREAARKNLAWPEFSKTTDPYVIAMAPNKGMAWVKREDVDYILPTNDDMFSDGANLVPLKSGVKGMRLLMGSKYSPQALPLVDREAPLVRTADPASGSSMERRIGRHLGAVRASKDATVKAVRKNRIDLVYSDGTTGSVDLYENFPYARSTYIRNNAAVKAGDRVKKGDLLAHSNFTDKEGVSALGTNLRVAYWNYDGLVFEDAIVISESAAKKLKSEHMYHSKIKKEADLEISKAKFRANFPSAYNKEQLDKIDEETGMIKPGSIVRYGDPLALAISEQDPKTGGSLGRRIRSNKSVTWQKKTPGIVTDATEGKDKYYINVRTNAPMNVGDKLSIRFGGKGVISKVVKDSDMPTDPKGRKMDVIMSPLGVVSRTNPAQKIEAQLGKVAAKTGVPYVLPGFLDESMVEFAHKELQKHRLSDKEDLVDPRTGRKIPGVFTGVSYFYKMQHTSEGKGKGRSQAKYTAEDQPAKGGKSGAKHLGKMYQEALLAHGATEVLKDMKLIKGQKNDAFWRQLKLGQTPTMPKTPLVYEKFKELLRAGGVQLSEGAFSDDIFSMTNKQAVDLTGNRKITSGDTYTAKNLKPIAGGLFDPEATGSSANGDRWSYIELPMPMPNPIMADPLRRILGLKQAEMEDLIASGDKHLKAALDRVDVKQEKAKALNDIKHGIRSKRDDAVKKFRFLHAFETNEVKPSDFLMTRVPVLPPRFRPITSQGGMAMVADPNYLYKSLIESSNDYKDTEGLPEEVRKDARRDMWDSYKALIGISDPKKDQLVQKNVKGILSQIFGKGSPKCYDSETEILTEAGWVPFPKYTGEVKVATMHPLTHRLEYHAPSDVIHEDYTGDMLELTFRGGVTPLVTPNHRNWLKYRSPHDSDPTTTDGWVFETAEITEKRKSRAYLMTAPLGGYVGTQAPTIPGVSSSDLALFAGWWTAEGWIHSGGKYAELCITDMHPEYIGELDQLMVRMGLPYGRYERDGAPHPSGQGFNRDSITWSVRSEELVNWLTEHIGRGAHNKRAFSVKEWENPYRLLFLEGYLKGDGHKNKQCAGKGPTNRYTHPFYWADRFSTIYPDLANDLCDVFLHCGIATHISDTPCTGGLVRASIPKASYVTAEGPKTRRVPYTGQVHCVTVPNGLVVVRRKGRVFISGNSGFFQRRVLGTNIDMSGLGVVAPNPSLKLNQAGIPEKMAWDLYEPFVIRDLVQQGVPATEAAKAVQAKNPLAYKALQSVVTKRPVILNRPPTLHKYSVMGFWPVLVKGATVQVPPAIVGPYAMDFDGDSLLTLIRVEINQEKLSEAVSISDPKGILRFETQTQEDEMHDPNTPIHIHNRTIRIEDLPRLEDTKVEKSEHMTEWDVPKGIEIYAYDKDTGEHRMFEVTKLSQHDDIDMVDVLIGTKRAYPTAITCSTDHSLVYYEPSTGEVVDGPPAEALDKYVPVIKKMNSDSSTGPRKFLTIGNQVKATFDIGVFIGAMIGDGWVDVANVAYISSVYPELRDALQNTVDTSSIPQNSPSGHKTNPRVGGLGRSDSLSTKVNFHLKDRAAQDLKDMIGSGAENKTIPWQCLDCGPAHLRGILSGLLSTDGTVNIAQAKTKKVPTRNVSYETTSPYLRDGVQLLLKKLGMRSSVCVYKGTKSTAPCYKITISSLDFGKFLVDNKDFHLPHADKQAALEKFRELSTDTPPSNMEMALDVVPYPEHIFEVMSWLRPLTSITSTGMSPLRKKGAMPRVKAEEFIAAADKADWADYSTSKKLKKEDRTGLSPEKLHELFLQWKRIVSDDSIMWQPVTEVTSIGKKTCWDITVPGPLTFATASGVIVQDTASFTVPVSDEAVSQVIDRMMPDRNLISARSGQPSYKLTNEYLQGLYLATKNPTDKQPVVFNTVEEAKKAYRMGKIAIDDPITILE